MSLIRHGLLFRSILPNYLLDNICTKKSLHHFALNKRIWSSSKSTTTTTLLINCKKSQVKFFHSSTSAIALQKVNFINSKNITKPVKVSNSLRLMSQNVVTKKRTKRKAGSRVIMDEFGVRGYDYMHEESTYPVVAYACCDELKLEELNNSLIEQGLYIPTQWHSELDMEDVIHVTAKYEISNEPREIFFFREGTVVFWNVSDLERLNVLKFLKKFEDERYEESEVMQESEYMLYSNLDNTGLTKLVKGKIYLNQEIDNILLEKYTFANAMSLSVKLGIWESTLEKFVDGIEHITDELKRAETIKISRAEVLQKTGELFALRHKLNLNSDLLDTPDFYWERERLETLYQKTCNYLSINRRTNVMNEKLSQCCELLELISSHLNDEHHVRLEWMIIALITIEVGFEIVHLIERYGIIGG